MGAAVGNPAPLSRAPAGVVFTTAGVGYVDGCFPVATVEGSGIGLNHAADPANSLAFTGYPVAPPGSAFAPLSVAPRLVAGVLAVVEESGIPAARSSDVSCFNISSNNNTNSSNLYSSSSSSSYTASSNNSSSSSSIGVLLEGVVDFDVRLERYLRSLNAKQLYFRNPQRRKLGKGNFGDCSLLQIPCPLSLAAAARAAGRPELVTKGIPLVVKRLKRKGNTRAACEREAAVYIAAAGSRYLPRLYCQWHGSKNSFLVFEAVSSSPRDLSKLVKACAAAAGAGSKHLPLQQMLRILLDASRGLRDLHDCGLCHCDTKPENMLPGKGRTCLIDMGLVLDKGAHLWGGWQGTRLYMDPVILLWHREEWDLLMEGSYDYFSLGLVFVYMLALGDEAVVKEALGIATRVQHGMEYERGEQQLWELLGQELAAVMEQCEQQLQQEGIAKTGELLGMLEDGVKRMVAGLLLKEGQQRWSNQELEGMVAGFAKAGQAAAAISAAAAVAAVGLWSGGAVAAGARHLLLACLHQSTAAAAAAVADMSSVTMQPNEQLPSVSAARASSCRWIMDGTLAVSEDSDSILMDFEPLCWEYEQLPGVTADLCYGNGGGLRAGLGVCSSGF